MMKLTLWRVPMRSVAACSAAAFHDQSTVRKNKKATMATTETRIVRLVRSLLRPKFRYAIVASCISRLSQVERTLVQAMHGLGALGGGRIVRHHDDGLVELGVQLLEQVQDVVRAVTIEITGRLVRHDDLRVGDD